MYSSCLNAFTILNVPATPTFSIKLLCLREVEVWLFINILHTQKWPMCCSQQSYLDLVYTTTALILWQYIWLQVWDILDSNFENNSAKEMGGGISGLNGVDMNVVNSTFRSNIAYREGGALNVKVRSSCTLYLNGFFVLS